MEGKKTQRRSFSNLLPRKNRRGTSGAASESLYPNVATLDDDISDLSEEPDASSHSNEPPLLAKKPAAETGLTTLLPGPRRSLIEEDEEENEFLDRKPPATPRLATEETHELSDAPLFGRRTASRTPFEEDGDQDDMAFRELPPPSTSMRRGQSQGDDNQLPPSRRPLLTEPPEGTLKPPGISGNAMEDEEMDEDLLRAIEASKQDALPATEMAAVASSQSLSKQEQELMKEHARTLRGICSAKEVVYDVIDFQMKECKDDQAKVTQIIETGAVADDTDTLLALLDLNEFILGALSQAEERIKTISKAVKVPSVVLEPSSIANGEPVSGKEDIFGLICLLRSQKQQSRLSAVLALMGQAKAASKGSPSGLQACKEIRSLGGLHSLLAVFRGRSNDKEVAETQLATALTIAYLIPTFVLDYHQERPSTALSILECMAFLATNHGVESSNNLPSRDESLRALIIALTSFWINYLEPLLTSGKALSSDDTLQPSSTTLSRAISVARMKVRERDTKDSRVVSSEEVFALQEVIDTTAFLVTRLAGEKSMIRIHQENIILLVQQLCILSETRAHVVKNGICHILAAWIRSDDEKQRNCALLSLGALLSSDDDKYMCGWVHSQIVSEGILSSIAQVVKGRRLSKDVCLALAKMLSSLCTAPNTRDAAATSGLLLTLIDFICESSGDDTTDSILFESFRAVLGVLKGSMVRSYVGQQEFGDRTRNETFGTVLREILSRRDAVRSIVAMTTKSDKALSRVGVEVLRLISEDRLVENEVRAMLCQEDAAMALGSILSNEIHSVVACATGTGAQSTKESSARTLYEALCTLSNIIDPIYRYRDATSLGQAKRETDLLHRVLRQVEESGGMEALLQLASLSVKMNDRRNRDAVELELVQEACRCLAFLASMMATPSTDRTGQASKLNDVFDIFHILQSQTEEISEEQQTGLVLELLFNLLQGFANLATSAPLQTRIVDTILPFIVRIKSVHPNADIAAAANQAFFSLEFTDDEVVAQIAGNNPSLLADWFCLKRSLLIQSMASDEIKYAVVNRWKRMLEEVKADDSFTHQHFVSSMQNLVDSIDRRESESNVSLVREQFHDIYGNRYSGNSGVLDPSRLLANQVYPLQHHVEEAKWVLSHWSRLFDENESEYLELSSHVEKLLRYCIPSELLRSTLVPMDSVQVRATNDFKTILMPKRKYFSFRREGQLVAQLCETSEFSVSETTFWNLAFTDSCFAGEFSESLVQSLYLCPRICAISFMNTDDSNYSATENDDSAEGLVFASLIGSLPPWISHLTFEKSLSDREMRALVAILDTMGRLSAQSARALRRLSARNGSGTGDESDEGESGGQGKYAFIAIRQSIGIRHESWKAFFELFGRPRLAKGSVAPNPFLHLKQLDLSGNRLGDDLCAYFLENLLETSSGCSLRDLDLSDCSLEGASRVLAVIRNHYQKQSTEGKKTSRSRSLDSLRLARNRLFIDKAWLGFVSLLKNNVLGLRVLDISSNEIDMDPNDYDVEIFISSLVKNTTLEKLDMSANTIRSDAFEQVILNIEEQDTTFPLIVASENAPPLPLHLRERFERIQFESSKLILTKAAEGSMEESHSEFHASLTELDSGSPLAVSTIEKAEDAVIPNTGDNMITVLFSEPLVYRDMSNAFQSFAKLDLNMERELLWQCLKEASREIELAYDNATHDRLLAAITKRCKCLHYSGHGHPQYLPFERLGDTHWLEVDEIRSMIDSKEGGSPFEFVFVSACFSGLAGETFASAGVPHVVCCQQEYELKDAAALAFTRQFYLALAVGHTVQESFDFGLKAVRASPNLSNASTETEKFVLLPRDGNHDVPIFNAKTIPTWPPLSTGSSPTHSHSHGVKPVSSSVSTKGSELCVRNMMQEDPCPSPPQFFIGREVDMYYVLRSILEKRLVNVVGEIGIGRSSLVCALCHYINQRASTIAEIENIYYIKIRRTRTPTVMRRIVAQLVKKMNDSGALPSISIDAEYESVVEEICKSLKNSKSLLVFDRIENLQGKEDSSEFPMLLSALLRETRNVKILMTATEPLGIPSVGGQVEHLHQLGPLNFSNTVRLFANLCSYLPTPHDRRRLFESVVTDSSEAELMPDDPGLRDDTKKVFALLGDGIPAKIEKEAYQITKENYMELKSGRRFRT